MNILIAPNAFKNSLGAMQVAAAIERGLKQSSLNCSTTCFPIADGGDGTGNLIIAACNGKLIEQEVHGPLGRKVQASFGLIDNGKTAVIEMAAASGLRLLQADEPVPLRATSFGTGELMKFALDEGVKKIIIAIGGSATVDGGCGILNALGILFTDNNGNYLPPVPESLIDMGGVDISGLDQRILNCGVVILCDVDNKLLGPTGAATVFGPKKGATPEDVHVLDNFLANFAKVTLRQTGIDIATTKHSGTAGGAAAGLHAWINARLVNGTGYFLSVTKFEEVLKGSNLVITGEGSIDHQTLGGKGPFGVASRAKALNIPVIGIAGKIPLEADDDLNNCFDALLAIGNEPSSIDAALENTTLNLIRTATMAGNLIAVRNIK